MQTIPDIIINFAMECKTFKNDYTYWTDKWKVCILNQCDFLTSFLSKKSKVLFRAYYLVWTFYELVSRTI
jgi:hypothetical protein